MPSDSTESTLTLGGERRIPAERRRNTLKALLIGSLRPRRMNPRRSHDRGFAAVDWHHPQWLAVALLILLLSCADAFLTLVLLSHGATEINPFMAPLVTGTGHAFALWKLGLTSTGVVVLTLLARMRAFGRLPVGSILYTVLAGYVVLVTYEMWLLDRLTAFR